MKSTATKEDPATILDLDKEHEQLPLTRIERAEAEETEVQRLVAKSMDDAIARTPNLTVEEVTRVLEARMKLIQTVREIGIKLTAPQDWTLYRARDNSILGVPNAAGNLKIRRWAGVSVFNHRGVNGEPGKPTVREGKSASGETITIVEGLADGRSGSSDVMPGVYFCVRSDDDFIGRATKKNNPRAGGPREQDLISCWRTGIDSKIVRMMTGTSKVSEDELKRLGIDVTKCTKGSGFGNAQDRAAGSVAEGGVMEAAGALWKDIMRGVNGDIPKARSVLKEITSYPSFKGSDGSQVKAFEGIDAPERFTTMKKVDQARAKFEKHPMYVPPQAADEPGSHDGPEA